MKDDRIGEWQEQLRRAQAENKKLLEEVEGKNKVIAILLTAGLLDKDKLEQACELAGVI